MKSAASHFCLVTITSEDNFLLAGLVAMMYCNPPPDGHREEGYIIVNRLEQDMLSNAEICTVTA